MNSNQERNLEKLQSGSKSRRRSQYGSRDPEHHNRNPGSGSTTLEMSHTKKLRSPSTGIHKYVRKVA